MRCCAPGMRQIHRFPFSLSSSSPAHPPPPLAPFRVQLALPRGVFTRSIHGFTPLKFQREIPPGQDEPGRDEQIRSFVRWTECRTHPDGSSLPDASNSSAEHREHRRASLYCIRTRAHPPRAIRVRIRGWDLKIKGAEAGEVRQ